MLVMPRRRKKDDSASEPKQATPKTPPNRSGVPLYVYIPDDMGAALQKYLDESLPRVSKTSAVEAAMAAFLEEKGYWPPRTEGPVST